MERVIWEGVWRAVGRKAECGGSGETLGLKRVEVGLGPLEL